MPKEQSLKNYRRGYSKGTKWAENILLEIFLDKRKSLQTDNHDEDYRDAFYDAVIDVMNRI